MSTRSTLTRGVVLVAAAGLIAGALASTSGAAAPLTKAKVKKIATKVANKVFNSKIGTAKAGDAHKLDGQDSTEIGSRVASGFSASPTGSVLASTSITVPANGYLIIDGIANIDDGTSTNDTGSCLLRLNTTGIGSSEYGWTVDDVESETGFCASHHVQTITPGTYTVDLFVSGLAGTSIASDGRVTALYVPYGPTGARP